MIMWVFLVQLPGGKYCKVTILFLYSAHCNVDNYIILRIYYVVLIFYDQYDPAGNKDLFRRRRDVSRRIVIYVTSSGGSKVSLTLSSVVFSFWFCLRVCRDAFWKCTMGNFTGPKEFTKGQHHIRPVLVWKRRGELTEQANVLTDG